MKTSRRIKLGGILSKICFYLNNEYIGEYYTQNNTLVNEKTVSFLCKTKANLILNSRILAGMQVEGVDIFEISDFIVSSAGLFNSISLPDGYKQTQSWYTIIIPIIGLQIPGEFGIGGIEFCTKCNDEIKRAIEYNKSFDDFEVFALVHINSEKMYSALVAARRQIEQSIDLLISILKDDSLFSTHSLDKHISERCIDNFQSKVSLSPLVYIESPFNNKRLFCNLTESVDNSNLLVTEQFLQHKVELEKAELLLLKANGTNDKEITPLFNSLKWIRKAWDTNDFEDKIINCIIALEFIVSKEPNVVMMGKSVRKSCAEAIGAVIHESHKDDPNKEEYLKKIIEKFHRAYTETPFMLKLTNLIGKLSIPVSEDELRLIKSARTQRNEIIHGKNDILLPTDKTYKLCECISENPQELTVELFKLINHHYVKIHFFSVSHAIDIFKGNTENRIIGELVKRILGIDGLEQFGKANIPIGKFTDKLSVMSFNNSVKYQLPTEITATPELIRLSNSLTVECQRLNLVQKIFREYYTDPRFSEAVKRFDELKGMEPILPYSKEDRKILKTLKNEYLETKIDLIYFFVSTLTYIKCMIFDSFYDNIFEVYETKDVLTLKEKPLDGCRFVQIVMNPNEKTFGANTGWILKLHSTDNTIVYGQIFSKQMKFTQNKCIITVKALVHDIL